MGGLAGLRVPGNITQEGKSLLPYINLAWMVLNIFTTLFLWKGLLTLDKTLSEATADLTGAVDATVTHEKQDDTDKAALAAQLATAQSELATAKANAATPEAIAAIEAQIQRLNDALNPPAA